MGDIYIYGLCMHVIRVYVGAPLIRQDLVEYELLMSLCFVINITGPRVYIRTTHIKNTCYSSRPYWQWDAYPTFLTSLLPKQMYETNREIWEKFVILIVDLQWAFVLFLRYSQKILTIRSSVRLRTSSSNTKFNYWKLRIYVIYAHSIDTTSDVTKTLLRRSNLKTTRSYSFKCKYSSHRIRSWKNVKLT